MFTVLAISILTNLIMAIITRAAWLDSGRSHKIAMDIQDHRDELDVCWRQGMADYDRLLERYESLKALHYGSADQ